MSDITEYYKSKRISNSLLGLANDPVKMKQKLDNPDAEDDQSYFRKGKALDCLLTTPELWEEEFFVINAKKPQGMLGTFVDNLPGGLDEFSTEDLYEAAWEKAGYRMALNKIIGFFWENENAVQYYHETNGLSDGKIILPGNEYEEVMNSLSLIQANPYLNKYFFPVEEHIEILKQVPIYFKYKGEECKALLDGIYIDHLNKIIRPYDLKTTAFPVRSFLDGSYLTFGYYRQAAFYSTALGLEGSPVKKLIEEGYTVDRFRFIVAESKLKSTHPAICYVIDEKDIESGLKGGTINGKYYKGIDELLAEYVYYRDTDSWTLPLDLITNQGEIYKKVFDD